MQIRREIFLQFFILYPPAFSTRKTFASGEKQTPKKLTGAKVNLSWKKIYCVSPIEYVFSMNELLNKQSHE